MTIATRTALTLESAIWPDNSIHLADAGFPLNVRSNHFSFDPARIALVQLPTPDGSLEYAFGAWKTINEPNLFQYVNQIIEMDYRKRVIILDDGAEVTYGPSGDCGCGSRMQGFNPWPAARLLGTEKPAAPWSAV